MMNLRCSLGKATFAGVIRPLENPLSLFSPFGSLNVYLILLFPLVVTLLLALVSDAVVICIPVAPVDLLQLFIPGWHLVYLLLCEICLSQHGAYEVAACRALLFDLEYGPIDVLTNLGLGVSAACSTMRRKSCLNINLDRGELHISLANVRRHRHRTDGATNARERSDQHSA